MNQAMKIISSKGAVLRALLDSKINRSVIGIHSRSLGAGMFLTCVSEILLSENQEPLIVLIGFDMAGYVLPKKGIRLSEIIRVMPFASRFESPFLKNHLKLLPNQSN